MGRIVLATALLGAASAFWPAAANEDLMKLTQDPKQWAIQTGDYANTRFSKLNQITKDNAARLQPVWTFSTGVLRGHEGGPLVIGDMMYVHTPFPNNVFALDLNNDGRIIWKYEPKQDPTVIPVMCCDTVYRGLAYADGKIFLHQADTTLVALDAKTGAVAWSVKNGDPKKGETNTATVMPVKDKVLVGISGGEYGVRGHVTAYDMKTGKQAWRAYSTGPDNDMLVDPEKTTHLGKPIGKDSSLKTWQGEQWKIGGSTTWGWYSYDPESNLVYYGTANPSTWNPKQRPGDNKWSMTIMARDADSGMARWFYQMTPHDEWDFDGVNEMILVDQEIGGRPRKLLVHFDRNGLAYTLDRTNGELLVAEKYRSGRQLGLQGRHGQEQPNLRTPDGRVPVLDRATGRGRQHEAGLSGGPRHEGPAAGGVLAADGTVLCPDQSRLHGLRAVPGELHRGAALCRRDPVHVPASGRDQHGQLHRVGCPDGQDRLDEQGAVLGLVRRPGDVRRRGLLRNARRLSESRRRPDGRRNSTSSRHRPASSATSRPTSIEEGSTLPFCPASVGGPVSVSPPA